MSATAQLLILTPHCDPLPNTPLFADADPDQTASDITAWSGSGIGCGIPDRVSPRVVAAGDVGPSRRRTSWYGAVLRRSVCSYNRRTGQFHTAILASSEGAIASTKHVEADVPLTPNCGHSVAQGACSTPVVRSIF